MPGSGGTGTPATRPTGEPVTTGVVSPTDFVVKRGDRLPALAAVVSDGAGPVGIALCAVRLKLWTWDRSRVALDAVALNADEGTVANRGRVRYDWSATDTTDLGVGWFRAEFEVTFPDGRTATYPQDGQFVVAVAEDVR